MEKFALHNKEKEGKELKTLYELFKTKNVNGTAENIHESIILMLLCIGESPSRGEYTLPDNLNFREKIEKREREEQEALTKLEQELQ